MTFADSQVTYAKIGADAWGSFRLQVGGKDVTMFRDVPAEIAGYQLLEPYTYGPADFNFPQLSMFEVDDWGTGDLAWFDKGKPVRLKQVDDDGNLVRVVWKGFVAVTNITAQGTQVHCEGEATGRLANLPKVPDLFALKRRVGFKLWNAFRLNGLDLTPHWGGEIGVFTDGRGVTGSYLDYTDSLLAATIQTDGDQYTIRAKTGGGYHLELKDTTTIDFTAFNGGHGVDIDLTSDVSEEPNIIYGSGVAPSGLVWVNGKYPGLEQGEPPDYPMTDDSSFGAGTTDADTDTGDGVTVMLSKLIGTGYLDLRDRPGGFDADVTEGIKDLQDDAGLTQSGNMNPATWRALFDLDVTGVSLINSFVHPLAQASKVRKWNYTSNGSKQARNPDFDPTVIPVGQAYDYGPSCEKSRARKHARGVLHRSLGEKNFHGTVTFTSDVFAGDRTASDVDLASHTMSRLDIREGMNLQLRHFDNTTLLHVSVVNVTVDENNGVVVQVGVDTQARDAATLGEVIARNIESRSHPARAWKRQHLTNVNFRQVEFSESCGLIWNKVSLPGNAWTVIKIPAGQAGYISRIRIVTEDDEAAFVAALTAQKVTPSFFRQHVGDPFDVNAHGESKWTNPSIQHFIDTQRSLLGVWGDGDQPGGYFPRSHKNPTTGATTDAPITGKLLEDAGIDYHTFDEPLLYLAIYPDRDTVVKPQRILWDLLQNSAG